MVDYATLTGAARVAVGHDISAFFTKDESLVKELKVASSKMEDPIWQLPIHEPYKKYLKSNMADIVNSASKGPGATTAFLFLQEFVKEKTPWIHFDIMGSNTESLPGFPEGGEAMGVLSVYEMLKNKYK